MLMMMINFLFLSGFMVFSIWRKHLLMSLLSLEYMVLGLVMMLYGSMFNYFFVFLLIYLTFTACEGALGLSILVSMSRTHGGDYLNSFYLF